MAVTTAFPVISCMIAVASAVQKAINSGSSLGVPPAAPSISDLIELASRLMFNDIYFSVNAFSDTKVPSSTGEALRAVNSAEFVGGYPGAGCVCVATFSKN